jgi:hypothetical protein
MSETIPTLRAFPHPGRLALRGQIPGAEPLALAAAGRQALAQLRAALLSGQPGGAGERWLARLRGPARRDLPGLALHAAQVTPPGRQAGQMAVSLTLENGGGASASLAWRHDADTEFLHWTCRGGQMREDGACQGSASVAAALAR